MRKILTLPKWIVSSFDTETQSKRSTKPLKLKDAKEAERQAKKRGWVEVTFKSESGMDFYERPREELLDDYIEPDPHSCCGKKFTHAPDCWVVGGNVDNPNMLGL